MNNKLLERDLQTSISNLKGVQLKKMLAFYEESISKLTQKTFSKQNSKCHQCQIVGEDYIGKGYGRSEEQALSNATKHFFSSLVTSVQGAEIIRNALKFKDDNVNFEKKSIQKKPLAEINDTMILDDVSMICGRQEAEENHNCQCIYYEVNKENERKIKHLQARISLLSEENGMLKKLLLQDFDKENQSCHSNTSFEIN